MTKFLEELAADVIKNHSHELDRVTIVLPSKRASIFLQKHLSNQLKKTFWSPSIISIKDFVAERYDGEMIDSTVSVFELYEVHRKLVAEPETFDSFTKWGQNLCTDFTEIDQYMVDPDMLFRNLKDIVELDSWNVDHSELSPNQLAYLEFWNKIPDYYRNFTKSLKSKGLAYTGMAYRDVADNIEKIADALKGNPTYFAGFNALSVSEQTIIETCVLRGGAKVMWDMDKHYVDNPVHEAGMFYRTYKDKWNIDFNEVPSHMGAEDQRISVIESATASGQTRIASHLIQNEIENSGIDTAIVLADESLLEPTLLSLPPKVSTANVTMGFPLKHSNVETLFASLFEIQQSMFASGSKIHYKQALKLLRHQAFASFSRDEVRKLERDIVKHNILFLSLDRIKQYNIPLLEKFVTKWKDVSTDSMTCCHDIVDYIALQWKNTENTLGLEFLSGFKKLFNHMADLLTRYPYAEKISTIQNIYRMSLRSYPLSFYGEPLEGMQIMGMLETRALDFENLIILGTNEGILPPSIRQQSYIPYDLKRSLGLPSRQEKEAIFAYHFYRLIQRAKNIYLIHTNNGDEFGSAERSRFILQLEAHATMGAKIIFSSYTPPLHKHEERESEIEKNDIVLKSIDDYLGRKPLSPTAINTYIGCPLDFYYTYGLGMKESDKVEEKVEASTLGTIMHKVLETLYKPFVASGKPVTVKDLDHCLDALEKTTKSLFDEHFDTSGYKTGTNFLIFHMAMDQLRKFFQNEIAFVKRTKLPLIIRGLEQDFSHTIEVDTPAGKKTITIKGQIDRVDTVGDVTRIIDYKSGLVEKKDVTLKEWEDLSKATKSKAQQLFCYGWLFAKNTPGAKRIEAGIISLRTHKSSYFAASFKGDQQFCHADFEHYEKELHGIIYDIYDPSLKLSHSKESKYCRNCD
ncbi:MAG: hypothetical protein COB65_12910 [Thalassobium sp.]|nr:MAG: hypothetical protein COB65_12910 [Thalassobium sp.]